MPGTGDRRRSWPLVALVVGLAFAVGVGGTVLLTRDDGADDTVAPDEPVTLAEANESIAPIDPIDPAVPARTRSAEDGEAAVRGFLDAEMAEDFELAFDFLSDANRSAFGTAAGYVAAHADLVPPITGYTVEDVAPGTVVATVEYEPSLDIVVGLIPESARNTYVVTEGADGFGVDLEASTSEASYPSDEGAPEAVRTWAEARQGCTEVAQWEGGLLGSPALAEPLCGAEGDIEIGGTEALGPNEGVPLSAAFGEEVGIWSRVVPVTSPVELRAVVAPLGQDWIVVGVLRAGEGAGL